MKKFIFAVSLISSPLAFAKTNRQAKKELTGLCREVKRIVAKNSDPALQAREFGDYIGTKITDPGLKTVFEAIAGVDPTQKYDLTVRGAGEAGVPHWSCPALKKYFTPKN